MKDFARMDGWMIVSLEGEIDWFSASDAGSLIAAAVRSGARRIVVDMSAVPFMDSTGLNMLLGVSRQLRGVDGEVRIVAEQGAQVRRVIDLAGVGSLLRAYEDVAAACTGDGADAGG